MLQTICKEKKRMRGRKKGGRKERGGRGGKREGEGNRRRRKEEEENDWTSQHSNEMFGPHSSPAPLLLMFPQKLHHSALSEAVYKNSIYSTASPTLVIFCFLEVCLMIPS